MVQRETLTSTSKLKISKGKTIFFKLIGNLWNINVSCGALETWSFKYSVPFQSGLNKGCSNKPTAVNKRPVNVSTAGGGVQNSGVVREAATTSVATVLPQPTTAVVGKGTVALQDKAGKCCLYLVFGVPILSPPQMDIIITFFKNLELKFTWVFR